MSGEVVSFGFTTSFSVTSTSFFDTTYFSYYSVFKTSLLVAVVLFYSLLVSSLGDSSCNNSSDFTNLSSENYPSSSSSFACSLIM